METVSLTIDCARCKGFCCIELYFSKADGFPMDKPAGKPCRHLTSAHRCDIHSDLEKRGLKGCMAYDCFGAGQRAAATGEDFQRLYRLHQMLWYLTCAASAPGIGKLAPQIGALIQESGGVEDLDEYQDRVNALLKQVIAKTCVKGPPKRIDMAGKDFKKADLSGMDLTFTLLMAANLTGCAFDRASLLGADLRDADLSGADLSGSLFLTQAQVNGARGDGRTKLPARLARPDLWHTV